MDQRKMIGQAMNEKNIASKIMTITEAKQWRQELRVAGKKLVITNGCFDIIHRGHVTYLMKAREQGDVLLLAINSDYSVRKLKGPNRPITKERDRAFILACFPFIDAIIIFDSIRCDSVLKELVPDVYVKGGDYALETMDPVEKAVLIQAKSKIVFIPFLKGYSSSKIINEVRLQTANNRVQADYKLQTKKSGRR